MLAPTPCAQTGCHQLATHRGKCDEHKAKPWQGSTRKERLPQDWNTRRNIVLKRDNNVCYLCGQPGADTVDHIEPGDNHDLTNLAAVHDRVEPHCHRTKTAYEGIKAQQGNRIKRRH